MDSVLFSHYLVWKLKKNRKLELEKLHVSVCRNREDYSENKSSFVVTLPDKFENLPDDHFSLGMDITFYTNLNKYGGRDEAKEVLMALNDIAYDKELRDSVKNESVTQNSLLRGLTLAVV